jgi:hypothetical protein
MASRMHPSSKAESKEASSGLQNPSNPRCVIAQDAATERGKGAYHLM